jgi:hypothetical protein
MSSYELKIESARSIFEQHNSHVDEELKLDFDAFLKNLKAAGGTTEAALNLCTWEDIEECGGDKKIPRLLAKQISKVFRRNDEKDKRPKPITEKKALMLNTRELLEAYDPKDTTTPVAKRLMELSRGGGQTGHGLNPCIVFDEDNKVNVTASLECLDEIREGFEPRSVYILDGIPQKVYHIGDCPNTTVDENPLSPGNALRGSDHACHKTFRSWKDVPHKARVILRLALGTGELKIMQVGDVHSILDLLTFRESNVSPIQIIGSRFPQAAIKYKELEVSGGLPTLKLVRGKKPAKKQDPFFGGRGHKVF